MRSVLFSTMICLSVTAQAVLTPQPPVLISQSLGNSPREVIVADMNSDGIDDIVTLNVDSFNVTVLLGQQDGAFDRDSAVVAPFVEQALEGYTTVDFAIGLLDGDTHLDLAIAWNTDGAPKVSLLFGNGAGGFTDPPQIIEPVAANAPAGDYAFSSLGLGDITGDDNTDLVLGSAPGLTPGVLVFPGNGAGDFTTSPGTFFPIGFFSTFAPDFVISRDLNNDGFDDVIAIQNKNSLTIGEFALLLADKTGGFAAPVNLGREYEVVSRPRFVDFNNDEFVDMAIMGSDSVDTSMYLKILLNDGAGQPTPAGAPIFEVGDNPDGDTPAFDLLDFNKDNSIDVVYNLIDEFIVGILSRVDRFLMLGEQGGMFAMPLRLEQCSCATPHHGDINGDGNLDIVSRGRKELYVSLGFGNDAVVSTREYPLYFGTDPAETFPGDFDADGNPDLLLNLTGIELGQYEFRYGDGKGNFSRATRMSVPVIVRGVGDFNGDGASDILGLPGGIEDFAPLLSLNDSGGFDEIGRISPISGVNEFAAGDLNGDGHLDLVITDGTLLADSIIRAYLGDGTGGLSAVGTPFMLPESFSASIALGDVTGSAALDLVALDAFEGIFVLAGDGTGNLTPTTANPITLGGELTMTDFALVQLDSQNKLDFAAVNLFSSQAATYINDGNGNFALAMGSPFATANGPDTLITNDFDADGLMDLATLNRGSGTVSLYKGNGDGTVSEFPQSPFPVDTGAGIVSGASVDFDGDQTGDLIATTNGREREALHLFTSDIIFQGGSFESPR